MLQKLVSPTVDRRRSDAEALTEASDGIAMIEVEIQDVKNEGEAVDLVGDDHIREDRMVRSAGAAANDSDMYGEKLDLPTVVVHKEPGVGLVETAVAAGATAGTDGPGGIKGGHEIIKDRF